LKLLINILNNSMVSINVQNFLKESETIINRNEFFLEMSDFLGSQSNVNWNGAII